MCVCVCVCVCGKKERKKERGAMDIVLRNGHSGLSSDPLQGRLIFLKH